jgi:protein phosphatase
MDYIIDFAILCDCGKVRIKNQDNFWCGGIYLPSENDGLKKVLSASTTNKNMAVISVFDGMGGEKYGEIAAYIAAKTFDDIYYNTDVNSPVEFLTNSCFGLNKAICDYTKEKRTGTMGTTIAAVLFDEKSVYSCNLGDSKVFCLSGDVFEQISYDHVIEVSSDKKPQLLQFLGVPEDDFVIEPYIATRDYKNGDKYLICSDGLTDMVSQEEIKRILTKEESAAVCGNILTTAALENVGKDNITVTVCEIYTTS